MIITDGTATVALGENEGIVIASRGRAVRGQALVRLQLNGAPTEPGDRLAVIGNCPELGSWNLEEAIDLDCVNANTWFGEVPFNVSAGTAIGYKYVIFRPGDEPPRRESMTVRQRLVIPDGHVKWRDRWEQ